MPNVFISYAHVDNERGFDDQQGWIDWFFTTFKTKLRQLCGPVVDVWLDHEIEGTDALTPTIESQVRDARFFLSIVSPSYLLSDWCRAELRLFAKTADATGGLMVGTKPRIIKVLKSPVDRALEAAADVDMSDVIGYPFYRLRENGRHWEFDPLLGKEEREEFFRQVYEVALDTSTLLKNAAAKKSGVTIFVAETGSDLSGDAERLRREFRQFGHVVLPETPYGSGTDFEDRVRADLGRAQIAIHPISESLGPIPETLERRAVAVQYSLSLAAAQQTPLLRLVWMQAGKSPSDVADASLRADLEADENLRVCTLEEIKRAVEPLVQRVSEPPKMVVATTSAGRPEVYLVLAPEDAAQGEVVARQLVAAGCAVVLPLLDGDEAERRTDNDETLATCDAILVLHASSTDSWRRAKLRDMKRAFGEGRSRPFLARGLLLAGAVATEGGDTLDPDLLQMRAPGDDFGTALAPFLDALARNTGTSA